MRIIQLITLLFSFFLYNGALAQGTKISVYKDQNEAVQLVVYPSQVMCKKNFAVDISFPKGLHNSNEWLVWTLNYKDCNKNVRQIQMSTPIGKECSRVSEFLSIIQSGASSQIIGEHTTIEPRCEFSDIDVIIDVTDVRFVRSYQAPNSAQSSVQAPLVSSSSSVEDGQMILTSMSFRIPTFSGPDWKTQVGAIPNSTQLKFLEYKHIADFDGFFKVQYLGNVFYVYRNHVVNDANYFRCIK